MNDEIIYFDDFEIVEEIEKMNLFKTVKVEEKKKIKKIKSYDNKKKPNMFGLNEKEEEIVNIVLFGGIFLIFMVGGLMAYTQWYFAQ